MTELTSVLDKVSTFEVKLLDINVEALGIPDTDYNSVVKMPSSEFHRVCANLTTWGDSVIIATSEEGITFSVSGEMGSGNVNIKQNTDADVCNSTVPFFLKKKPKS